MKFEFGLVSALAFSLAPASLAQGSDQRLPPGSYVFLDTSSGELVARALVVTKDGAIRWQEDAKNSSPAAKSAAKTVAKPIPQAQAERQYQWESCNYPTIKWKARPLTNIPGGVAQLSTSYERPDNIYATGKIMVKLVIYKVAKLNFSHTVELLDDGGFKMAEISFLSSEFHPLTGTSLLEATGETICKENLYAKVRDYVVR